MYSEQEILNKRNVEALQVALKHSEARRMEDAQRVEQLMGTVTQLSQQVQELLQHVAVLRAQAMGHGPSR